MTRNLSVLSRVSSLAIAAVLTAGAAAQSFQGTPTVSSGDVFISEGSGTTDVNINSAQSVIDWTPDDNLVGNFGAINFQPSGTTATFSGSQQFAVLNRVNVADPSRLVAMSGTINGLVSEQVGGAIFFYSPSGFVIGSSAVINVGSLVLSASPIAVDGNGNFINGSSVTFNQAPNSSALINTVAGSQINAHGSGSYVALVAPLVTHHGTIRTDTAAALVAAEAATINFSPDGLFDIQVTVGTDDPNGVHVGGGTIARNSATEGVNNHYAYLVAVAKNDAVTMLVNNGGSVGFDTATSAAVEDNVVILSAGHDVSSGFPLGEDGNAPVSLTIDNATMSSDVYADITGGALVTTSTGSTAFGNNLTLFANDDINIQAINGNTLAIGGSVTANNDVFGTGPTTTGNLIRIMANGSESLLTIGGDVFLSANAYGADALDDGIDGGDATGGTIIVQSGSNAGIAILGSLSMTSDGFGGDQFFTNGAGGNGTGGIGQILANGGNSSISVGGNTFVSAEGQGGSNGECSGCNITGGNGTGGQILVNNLGGSGNALTFGNGDTGGDLVLDANGYGGSGDLGGGTGTGGQAQVTSGDGSSFLINSDLIMSAFGSGGYGFDATGGDATGGNAFVTFSGASGGLDVIGQALIDASASGGDGTMRGGDAIGGFVNVQISSGGTLNMPTLFASAGGDGGSGNVGGNGTGGRSWLQAITGGTANIGDAFLYAGASGGAGIVGAGGTGTGGHAVASADAATLNVTGDLNLYAGAEGGNTDGDTQPGGTGQGGQADIFASNGGTVNLDGFVSASANGFGGSSVELTSQAGDGFGGNIFFQASNGATLDADNAVFLEADGFGGFSGGDCIDCGGAGGDGTGGTVVVQSFGGPGTLVDVAGLLDVSASGFGADGFGGAGGVGQGGTARLGIQNGAGVSLGSDLQMAATGSGGWQTNGGTAGNGTGGLVDAFIGGTGGTLDVAGFADLDADGTGGNVVGVGGTAGNGLGGTAILNVLGGTAGFANDLSVHAIGFGGSAEAGAGGSGTGRTARINANGGDIDIGGSAFVVTSGFGGSGTTGGAGTGGGTIATFTPGAIIYARNGDIDIGFSAVVESDGFAGNGTSGPGGVGTGGWASIQGDTGGTVDVLGTIEGGVFITAAGFGGDSIDGIGGNAFGGTATIVATGGAVHFSGDLIGSAEATGGSGTSGGNAVGRITPPAQEETTPAITLFANGGGTITVDGTTSLSTYAVGGGGTDGAGGNAQGGEIDVVAGTGAITLGNLIAIADAQGGTGTAGGAGGSAVGGNIDIGWTLSGATLNATISSTDLQLTASGQGGAGGAGIDGNSGTDGGAGGMGTGGNIVVVASAAGGTLDLGDVTAFAEGLGGAGGNGGNGDSGTAGNGGVGGAADGGQIFLGSVSSDFATSSGGGATFGTTVSDASAFGGAGGNGGTSGGGDGSGGDGGAATGGDTIFLVRGVAVSADTVSLAANATGGDGGFGLVSGDGGNAATGFVAVESKDRFGHPDQRGTLTADAIIGQAIATGGLGAADGTGTLRGGNYFRVLNGDATIGSVSMTFAGDVYVGTNGPDLISMRDGAATIAGTFSYSTTGQLALDADNGSMSAGLLSLTAGNFVPDTFNEPGLIGGTYFADSAVITSGNNIVASANFDIGGDFALNAQGSIQVAEITTAGLLALTAVNGSIATANLDAGGDLTADAATTITTGNIISGGSVVFDAGTLIDVGNIGAVGSIALSADTILGGSMTAGGFVDLFAGGPATIVVGDLSGDGVYATSIGDITTGAIDSTLDVDLLSFEGSITTLDIAAVTDVTLEAAGAITTGDISTFGTVDANGSALALGDVSGNILNLTSTTGNVSTGNIDAFGSLNVNSAADLLFGSITAQLVDLNIPGSIIGGFIDSGTDITALAGADIDVGDLNAGGFDGEVLQPGNILLTAGGDIATGAATAQGFIDIFTPSGSISTGNLAALNFIDLDASGDVEFGDATADDLDFESGGAVTGGNIVAGTFAGGDAQGAVNLGNISVGIEIAGGASEDGFAVGIVSATSINVGNVEADEAIGFASFGPLNAGNLDAGTGVMALVGGDMSFGSITTAPDGRIYLADSQMFLDAGGPDDFDPLLVLNAQPLATGGSISINGPVSTGLLQAAAGNNFSAVAISAPLGIDVFAGGIITVGGLWDSGDASLASDDIEITVDGSISAGDIELTSTNGTRTVVGDGVGLPGYNLSNAEYGRLSANDINVVANTALGAAPSMIIGDLSVDASGGEGVEYEFRTWNGETEVGEGAIRIVGEVEFTGMGDLDFVGFTTRTFELDAATGLLSLTDGQGGLAGTAEIYATHVHVASGDILDQLAVNPQYDGYQDELNAPATVQRPEGVIRAASVAIEFGNAAPNEFYTLYVQNSGTQDTPAGFLVSESVLFQEGGEQIFPPGSIDLVINGQIETEGGTLTGIAVRDALVEAEEDLTPFTENSTINGCLLVGPCGVVDPPVPPGFTPTPGIQQEIVLINDDPLGPPEFGNEGFIDDNNEENDEGETSPIVPPDPLFDTSELGEEPSGAGRDVGTSMRSSPGLTETGDIDDPVSGSGNPALMETPPPPPPSSNEEKQQ